MKFYTDCYACFVRQTINAARHAGCGEELQHTLINKVLGLLQSLEPGITPPEVARKVHGLIRQFSNNPDPYKQAKTQCTQAALALYDDMKALIQKSPDPLGTALRLSIAGNIIDLGISDEHEDLWHTVDRVLVQDYAVDHEAILRQALEKADHVLYLGDNAGETVFDRLLIEVLDKPVIYAVRGMPILNDAVMEDALEAGLDKVATLIDNGADAPGTILSLCKPEFVEIYNAAPVIIAKGQGNYETLNDAGPKVFCLLQVKCPVIERDMGASMGGIILRQSSPQ
ncbi:MAG: DUF89 family protein [Desulfatibacillum sp.]|nr:DUF89 family protein [Desulfatibacillum sp.]